MSVWNREEHRRPAVAGLFYPADPTELRRDLVHLLAEAGATAPQVRPKALIVPHAGYVYSGATAARAYAHLARLTGIERVVLLGPAHRVALRGIALPASTAFETPLGSVPIDREAAGAIAGMPQVVIDDLAHVGEHALEVHLPFLQQVLGRFTVLPLVVGSASTEAVTAVIERLWGDQSTLIVVSSDLSHYLPYDDARRIDRATVATMLQLEPTLTHEQACGATPVNGLLAAARRRHLRVELLDLRNSGDTAGSRDRVVGYAALAFFETEVANVDVSSTTEEPSAEARGKLLLAHAQAALAEAFGIGSCETESANLLHEPGATFVTLRVDGHLRGCVGSLMARRTLGEDVRANACAAAFNDPRFAPLAEAEYPAVTIEISVLSPATPIVAASESELIAQLQPGVDGVILEYGSRRATLLPQVWEHLPDPRRFLQAVKQKAGLRPDAWLPEMRWSRYTVEKHVGPTATAAASTQPS